MSKPIDTAQLIEVANKAIEHEHQVGAKCDMCASAYPAIYQPFGGATSFDEVDAYAVSDERARNISELQYQFQSVYNNIMGDDLLTLEEKAQKAADAATDLARRVADVRTLALEEDGVEDGDNAFADDGTKEATFILEREDVYPYLTSFALADKAATKSVGGVTLRARDFADVGTSTDPETWKLPLVKRSGSYDLGRIADLHVSEVLLVDLRHYPHVRGVDNSEQRVAHPEARAFDRRLVDHGGHRAEEEPARAPRRLGGEGSRRR